MRPRTTRAHERGRGDRGVTLVEMVITIVIMAGVIGAAAMAFQLTVTSSASSNDRLRKSNDAQLITTLLERDAASVGGYDDQNQTVAVSVATPGVWLNTTTTDGFCDTAGSVMRLEWVERPAAAAPRRIASNYAVSGNQLTRTYCVKDPASAGGPATSQSTAVLGRGVQSAVPTCVPSCAGNGRIQPTPVIIGLQVTSTPNASGQGTPFQYTVTGFVRSGGNATFSNSDLVPLIALGVPNGGPCPSPATPAASGVGVAARNTSAANNGPDPWSPYLAVYGIAAINSSATTAATCGQAMNVAGTTDTYAATNTLIVSPGTCNGCGTNPVVSTPSAIPDPYAGTPPPTYPACSAAGSDPTVTSANNITTYSPGVYRNQVVLGGNGGSNQFVFGSGNGNAGPGVFVFCRGMLMCSGVRFDSQPGGVLFYFDPTGSSSTGSSFRGSTGSNCSGYQDVSMHVSGRPEWKNIVFWQPGTTNGSSIADLQIPTGENNLPDGLSSNIQGVIYAPNAQVEFYIPPNANRTGCNGAPLCNNGWPANADGSANVIEATVTGVVARNVIVNRDGRVRVGPGPQSLTVLTANPQSAPANTPITLTATVSAIAPATGTPTGSVQFFDDAIDLGNAPLVNGVATLTTTQIGGGAHPLTAVYSGDSIFASSVSATLNQINQQASSATTLTSSPNPAGVGQNVTFTATVTGVGTPTGVVAFYENQATPTLLGTGTLNAGVATFTTSFNSVGVRNVQAVYNGSATYAGSASPWISQTVSTAAQIALSASPTTAVAGQPITLTATVSALGGGGPTPTGTVTFFDGATQLSGGSVIVNGAGVATLVTTSLGAGTHQISAVYSGDAVYGQVTSLNVAVTITQAPSSLALTANPSTAGVGQTITLTATVTSVLPGFPTPTGLITFLDTSSATPFLGVSNLNAAGVATLDVNSLPIGARTIQAVYGGDPTFSGSQNTTVATVGQASPSVALDLGAGLNPSNQGSSITFRAQVQAPGGSTLSPTGTVTFYDNCSGVRVTLTGTVTYTTPVPGLFVAQLPNTTLTAGNHNVCAVYNGDANFVTATSNTWVQQVLGAATTLTLTSSPNTATFNFGQSVTFTATLTENVTGNATGPVNFRDGGCGVGFPILGTSNLSTTSGVTTATFTTSALTLGAHTICADYAGNATFAASTSNALVRTVNTTSVSMSVTATPAPNNGSSVSGQTVTITATFNPNYATGTVTFVDLSGPVVLNGGSPVTISGGAAVLTTSSLSIGSHPIQIIYNPDAGFTGDASTTQTVTRTVTKANTTTAVSVAGGGTSAQVGQPITYNINVSPAGGASGIPTGTVTLTDNGVAVPGSPFTLSGSGTASYTVTYATAATHTIVATYNGNATFNTSNNSPGLVISMAPRGFSIDTLASGGAGSNGQPSNGDQVIYTFNQTMSAGSILTSWTGATTNVRVQFCRTSGQTTVMTVYAAGAAAACGSATSRTNLGTVDMGDDTNINGLSRYMSSGGNIVLNGTLTMTTNGSGQSVVTLVIGTTVTGSFNGTNTGNTTIAWTTNAAATNTGGTAVVSSTITQTTGKRNF